MAIRQQIIISGVGGQGVLFVTRILAEAAIMKDLPVFTSETHGMAQRGGTVISHLKIGDFSSPLIRPFQADGLLVLKAENLAGHGTYLKSGGWAVVNAKEALPNAADHSVFFTDSDALALSMGNPKSVNLALLGYALAAIHPENGNGLFCGIADVESAIRDLPASQDLIDSSLRIVQAGYGRFDQKHGESDISKGKPSPTY